MKAFYTLLAFFIGSIFVQAQGDLALGQWAEHLPYNTGYTVTQSPTRVYYGTDYAIISILKEDTSQVTFFSKVDGLSDIAPSWIHFHEPLNMLIIGYRNGNIDLLDENGITNINDILRNTNIQGDKSIRHIYVD